MLTQAKKLVAKMKQTKEINFSQGWKLVTFFIGGNDLCKACRDVNKMIKIIFFYYLKLFHKAKYTAENYMKNIRLTLDYFQANLPRTLVNLVVSLDVTGIETLTGYTCRNMQK